MMKIKLLIKLDKLIAIVFFATLVSCGVSPKSNSKLNGVSEKFYTSFYKDNGNTIYYIKPIDFYCEKEKLKADFTIEKKEDKIVKTTINFSIFSNEKISKEDLKLVLINNFKIDSFKVLFNEPTASKKNEIRLSVDYPEQEVIKFDKNMCFSITTTETKKYLPNKKSLKSIEKFKYLID